MYVVIDTREKPKAIGGIIDYFDRNGIQHVSSKLLFGDYMDYSHPQIVVDRKQNIAELAKNCTTEHERFKREMQKAKDAGAFLFILVEQNRYKDRSEWVQVNCIDDLIRWSSPHTMVRGEQVFRILWSWMNKYPVAVEFCDKRSTGKRIIELISKGDNDER